MKNKLSSYWYRSAFFSMLQRFSLTVFGVINFMVLIRALKVEEMGIWALFLIVTAIFESTKSGLIKNAHIKFFSSAVQKDQKIKIASSSFSINSIVSLCFILFLFLFASILTSTLNWDNRLATMLLLYTPGIVALIFFSHLECVQQSHFDFKGVFAGYLTRQVVFFLIIGSMWLLEIPITLNQLAIYQSISIIAGSIVLLLFTKKYLNFRFQPSTVWTRKILGFGGYIFGTGILSNIVSNLDQLMTASFFRSAYPVAFYNTATRINAFIDMPSYAASEILYPKMSQAQEFEGNDRVKYLFQKMVSILWALIIPCALVVIIIPKPFIILIAGEKYLPAIPILQLYMLNSIIGIFQNQSANTLNSIGKPRLCFWLNTMSLTLKLIITYICLIYFGFYGSAIGTVLTSIVGGIVWYLFLKKHITIEIVTIFNYFVDFYRNLFSIIVGFIYKPKLKAKAKIHESCSSDISS